MKVLLFIFSLFLYSCSQELLPIGSKAPDFTLMDDTGERFSLSEASKINRIILVFYPGDNTPVCKKQLCEMRDNYEYLTEKGYLVWGINDGDATSHTKFKEKNNYPFPLLIDTDRVVSELYRCKSKWGIKRSVYVISKEGEILFASRGRPGSLAILDALQD